MDCRWIVERAASAVRAFSNCLSKTPPPPMTAIRKLLVANRSEIAIRVFRTAHELGIRTVAIYSHEDRYALHRFKADEAYQVGKPGEPIRAYLDIPGIIAMAKQHECRRHSSRLWVSVREPAFARACKEAGIIFCRSAGRDSRQAGRQDRSPWHRHGWRTCRSARAAPSRSTTGEARQAGRKTRLSRDPQGGQGRRRARHARGPQSASELVKLARTGAARGGSRLRQQRRLLREVHSCAPGTSKCNYWATSMATWSTCTSATARCSAGIRKWSRSPRRRISLDPQLRGDICDAALAHRPGGRLRKRRHRRVSGRCRHGRILLHRGQPAHPGRAHGDRSRHRRRHRRAPDSRLPRASRSPRQRSVWAAGQSQPSRATPCSAASRPKTPRITVRARLRPDCAIIARPAAWAFASMPARRFGGGRHAVLRLAAG